MIKCLVILTIFFTFSCQQKQEANSSERINMLAERYVRLGLLIGQYDGDFVDAYYGPDSLRPSAIKQTTFPKDGLLREVNLLINELKSIGSIKNDSLTYRSDWMISQLTAFSRRIKIFAGEYNSFDGESKELFGVTAPVYDQKHFQLLLTRLDSVLPGKGNISARFEQLSNRFIIPVDKLDTVFKTTIAEARKRTVSHYTLPSNESFTLEYVRDKPWSGYNWYKGGYNSIIQINTDLPIFIDRAIDLACHEGYPGHHVYNMLLEENIYRRKGWVEISLYPLFSPQSMIAEGSANFGIEVAFPGENQLHFISDVLLPLAGLDTIGIKEYMSALLIKSKLNYARNEAARGLLNGTMTEAASIKWLTDYALYTNEAAIKSIKFINKYRSYVINYNYGMDLVKNYIESKGGADMPKEKRWELFKWLLSNEIIPTDLMPGKP
ncbi:MAG: hypothetical protein ABIN01_17815 [Ferruginibacter sp.]